MLGNLFYSPVACI